MIKHISTRDKKLLLMLLGLVVFAVGYLLVFRPQMEKAGELQTANLPLKEKLAELEQIEANQSMYLSETEKNETQVSDYMAMFPAEVREEDAILLARRMENSLGMWAHTLGFTTNQFVASLEDSSANTTDTQENATLSEQTNEKTQDQINEIEGTQEETRDTQKADIDTSAVALYRTQNTIEFSGSYQNLKDVVDLLAAESGRTTIDSVEVDFSSDTGELGGTMVVDMYAMTGTGREYSKPDASVVRFGNRNLFGTLSGGQTKKVQTTDTTGTETTVDGADAQSTTDSTDTTDSQAETTDTADTAGQTQDMTSFATTGDTSQTATKTGTQR